MDLPITDMCLFQCRIRMQFNSVCVYRYLVLNKLLQNATKSLLVALCSVAVARCLSHYVKCDVILCMCY